MLQGDNEARSEKRRLFATIEGRVQGVGFRWFVMDTVRQKYPEIVGWVKNMPDGQVEVIAEGPEKDVDALLNHLKRGPRGARVDRVVVKWTDPRGGMLGFDVTY